MQIFLYFFSKKVINILVIYVVQGGFEPPWPDFQSGALTNFATVPFVFTKIFT